MVSKLKYVSEFIQSILVGVVLSVMLGILVVIGGINAERNQNLVLIISMFMVGMVSVWWALYKIKGNGILGRG